MHARDITFAMVSPAPQANLRRYAERMGWTDLPWYTICTERFSADFGVDEWFGFNVFLRDGNDVYRTYFLQHGRVVQSIGTIWSLSSLTPYGGQSEDEDVPEGWPQAPWSFWFRRHDEFTIRRRRPPRLPTTTGPRSEPPSAGSACGRDPRPSCRPAAHGLRSCGRERRKAAVMGIERGWRACAAVLAITCAGLAAGPASAQVAPAGSLDQARSGHTATLLGTGKVLVVGGSGAFGHLASAEVYDPATNTWESAGSMATARSGHSATLLTSGRVLVVGGSGGMANTAVASAEIYDPATNSWSQAVDDLAAARSGHTATLLPSGEVLVAGGSGTSSALASAEIYDPGMNAWRSTASLPVVRFWHSAVALATGEVLVFGGVSSGTPVFEANSYPPVNDAWPAAGILTNGRYFHAAALLASGKVLVIGGQGGSGLLGSAEQYDPVTRSWSPTGSLVTPRYSHTATTLGSGKVLVTGGYSAAQEASMELYDPITGVSSLVGSLATTREEHTATLLASGKVLVVGGIGRVPTGSRRPSSSPSRASPSPRAPWSSPPSCSAPTLSCRTSRSPARATRRSTSPPSG